MFELYLFVLIVWWIALIITAFNRHALDSTFYFLVAFTFVGDVFMGLMFLGWITNAPLFQEMTHEANRKVFTHFLVPWFAPQGVLILGFLASELWDSRKNPMEKP